MPFQCEYSLNVFHNILIVVDDCFFALINGGADSGTKDRRHHESKKFSRINLFAIFPQIL